MSRPTMVRLRDLGDWSGGNTPSKANPAYWANGTIPWVSPKDMKVDEIISSADRVSNAALSDGRVSLVPAGSVLVVTRSGILAHTLPVAVTKVPVTINQDLKALTPKPGVLPMYVAYALRGAARRILKECSKHGTTVASIETNALLDFEVLLVDLDQQRRTVAEIEKQFSRVDEAVANLKRVKARLEHYVAAVLYASISGRLVGTDCLSRAPDQSTSNDELEAIAAEATPTRLRRAVPTVVKPSPAAARIHVPAGWASKSVSELLRQGAFVDVKDGNHGTNHPKASEFSATGLPFVTATEVRDFQIDYAGANRVSGATLARLKVGFSEPEDVILTHKGTVGRTAVNAMRCVLSPQTTYYRLHPEAFLPKYLQYYFASPQFAGQLAEAKSQTTRDYVPISDQYRLFVLRPPLAVQAAIVSEVDRRLSIVGGVAQQLERSWKRVEALKTGVSASLFGDAGR